jgi:hypothetical protein
MTFLKEPEGDILAVHTISHSTMARDGVSKIFDAEGSFESRGKKNPPNGATRDAKQDMKSRCHWYGAYVIVTDRRNYVTLY